MSELPSYNPNAPEIVEANVAALAMDKKMTKAAKKRRAAINLNSEAAELETDATTEGDQAVKEFKARSSEVEMLKHEGHLAGAEDGAGTEEKDRLDYAAYLELMLKQGTPKKQLRTLEQLKGRSDVREERTLFERWQRIQSQNMFAGAKVRLTGKYRDSWLRHRRESLGRSFGELDEDGVGVVESITPYCKLVFRNERGGLWGKKSRHSPFDFTAV